MGSNTCARRFMHVSDPGISHFKHAPEGTYKDGRIVSSGFACLGPATSPAPLSTCPKTCQPCSEQFRPLHWQQQFPVLRYSDTLNDLEATSTVDSLIDEARKGLEELKKQIDRYGDAIMKRWTKRNQQKRKGLLQQAMPNMFKEPLHQHVVSDLCCADLGEYQTALLLQYLDLESMSEDLNVLLAIMHQRWNTTASDCVMFDSLHLTAFFSQGLLEASYNPHCVVMHNADNKFGALVHWEKDLAHEWSIIGFPRAKLILEAQVALSKLLNQMAQLLLHNGQDQALEGSEKWQALVGAGFRTAGVSQHDVGAVRRVRYLPRDFALSSLHAAFGARYVDARETCWLVQTDPAYARQLLSTGETSGFHTNGCCSSKQLSLTGLMLDIVERQQIWGELTDEAKHALDVSSRYHDGSVPDSHQLEDYKAALNFLESRLRTEFAKFAGRFRNLAITLGTFDEHFSFEVCHQAMVKSSRAVQHKDIVFWCASGLHDHSTLDVEYPGRKLETIERYSYSPKSKDRGRLHQLLLECVSDMRTVDEAIMALLCHRPRTAGAMTPDEIVALIPSMIGRPHWDSAPFATIVDQRWEKHLNRLWPPLESLLALPSMSGLVTRKALSTFDRNHQALQEFWEQARLVRLDLLVELQCPEKLHAEILEPMAMGITPEHIKARDEERRLLLKEIERKEAAAAALCTHRLVPQNPGTPRHQSVPMQTQWGTGSFSKPALTTPKAKIKTRPDEAPSRSPDLVEDRDEGIDAIEAGVEALSMTKECIKVAASTMNIVNRMFTSYGKHTQSNVRWDHFVNALIDIGVSPSQSEGSAVTFKDVTRGTGAIVLHRPHPDPSVNPICMRSFGKRLQKNFGWELDMFEERT
ncbi:hypothetical protein CLAFUW4_00967 [Fulvia fulva]|uniref:Uncharacterized protein n=1 Tax=Passalora fulva TaxID=5499 RepID=A0A9Q8L6I7_PASFU|nr:uncharacterized protein CLAFUR5_00973 [Fulvia fulva]KAK4634636.1 hypothetical protein CLAFUR4_00968 [Fulvia fulva]KAK4636393.1 hypothetical protein CLAFUR0_00969 [Fulvia fulva]UJO11733.1 hypothetical protein CLAFUR5_00973 [Fulvia fulva]WPV08402.1 hypothetical protein CLAFUW4_00967 [Fulvia fulva]WPV25084.1 hypothetical protein CLAFUW7_00849 [Fulvia fulva]